MPRHALRRRAAALLTGLIAALSLVLMPAGPAAANHLEVGTASAPDRSAGATTTYTVAFRIGAGNGNLPAGAPTVVLTFPAGFDLSAAALDIDASGMREGAQGSFDAFPTYDAVTVDDTTRQVRIEGVDRATTAGSTEFRLVVRDVANPTTTGARNIGVTVLNGAGSVNTSGVVAVSTANGPVASIALTAPADGPLGTQAAGVPLDVRIAALDAYGNLVDGSGGGPVFTGTVDLTSTVTGTSGLGTTEALVGGVLIQQLVLTQAASEVTLTATVTGGVESGTAAPFATVAGPADRLVVVMQPTDGTPGPLGTVAVQVQDEFGNVVTTDDGTVVTVATSGAALTGTLTQSTLGGVATFTDLAVVGEGTSIVFEFTSPSLTAAASVPFSVTVPEDVEPPVDVETPADVETPVDEETESVDDGTKVDVEPIGGETPERQALADTGVSSGALVLLAVLLMGVGVLALRIRALATRR